MPDRVMPDAGEVLRAFLGSRPTITAHTGPRIGITLTGADTAIRYVQIGGGPVAEANAVSHRFQVECWGPADVPDDGTASLLARVVAAETQDFVGAVGDAVVAGATADLPYPANDPLTGRPRYIVEIDFPLIPR